jgi:hypothetical protein
MSRPSTRAFAVGDDGDDRLAGLGHLDQGGHRHRLDDPADRSAEGLQAALLLGLAQGVAAGGGQAFGLGPRLGGLADERLGQFDRTTCRLFV